MLILLLLKKFK